MTGSQARDRAATDARRAWVVGGVLLITAALFDVVSLPVRWMIIPGDGIIGAALYAASLLIFAFGIRGSGSVTARRPLGTGALTFLAVWAMVSHLLWSILPADNIDLGVQLVLGYGESFIEGAVALVAAVQIARAGAVPRPWNWAPTWALAAVVLVWALQQILSASPVPSDPALIIILGTTDSLVRIGAAIFLGILAIVLANLATRSRTVAILPDDR